MAACTICLVYNISPSPNKWIYMSTFTCVLCRRKPEKPLILCVAANRCYTGAQCGASPARKGYGRASQTRTGVTSGVYGQPPPSTSPFSMAATASGEEGRQCSYRHRQPSAASQPRAAQVSRTSASQHSSPRPHPPRGDGDLASLPWWRGGTN